MLHRSGFRDRGTSSRSGFTLIETLVVVSIIPIWVSQRLSSDSTAGGRL